MNSQQRRRISENLAELADDPARESDWPTDSLAISLDAGWRGWCIADQYGGKLQPPTGLLECYEMLGRGDLTTALIVTQHDAALDLVGKGDNDELKRRLLPRFASGEMQTTVGISQLTTSRQGGSPAMTIARDGDGFRLNGLMPWVTAPRKCSHIVTGGVFDDGSQLLACLPCDRDGVCIDPPLIINPNRPAAMNPASANAARPSTRSWHNHAPRDAKPCWRSHLRTNLMPFVTVPGLPRFTPVYPGYAVYPSSPADDIDLSRRSR